MDLPRGSPVFVVCALFSLLASGCTPQTTIATNKAADYSGHPRMLFVATLFDPALDVGLFFASFQTSFEAKLRDCGVTTRFFSLRPNGSDPLQLDTPADPQVAALRNAIAAFRPDSFLAVRETGYRYQTDTVTHIRYLIEFTDAATRRAVWKAGGTLDRRLSTMSDAGAGFANEIADRLFNDGILTTCKVAAVF